MTTSTQTPERTYVIHANYEAFVASMVVLTLVNSVILVLPFAEDTHAVATIMNLSLSVFLLGDACYRFFRRHDRWRWLLREWGWLTFAGSAPVPFAGIFRLFFIWIGLRRIQHGDLKAARANIVLKRAQSTLLTVLGIAIVVFEVAGILILKAESASPEANIKTANDALWWGYVTMATVGYGDRYPVTDRGRLIGIVVMTVGVALFTGITGFLADWFRRPRAALPAVKSAATMPPDDMSTLLATMRQALDDKENSDQATLAALRTQLAEIERRLNG